MEENPDHDREEVPGRPAVSSENLREQRKRVGSNRPKRGGGIRPRGYACSSGGFSGVGE